MTTIQQKLLLTAASFLFGASSSAAEDAANSVVAAKIKSVEYAIEKINPPNLLVNATAQFPTSGFSNFVLSRVVYVHPPKDGIQDYFFNATPPSGIVTQVLTDGKSSDRWEGYPDWVVGVRVHGVGNGVVVKRFGDSSESEIAKHQFDVVGVSKTGDLQAAMEDAQKQIDEWIAKSGVSDQMVRWELVHTKGTRGGIAGLQDLTVTLSVTTE